MRCGTRNLFLTCEPKAGWRHVAVTQRRTIQDFAKQMRWLVDEAFPDAPVVRLVLDNLNTHRMASLYEGLPAGGGSTHRQAAGVPLHAQARQLVEYGGDGVQRAGPSLSARTQSRRRKPGESGECQRVEAQRNGRGHQLALYRQTQTSPPLPMPFLI